MKINIYKIFIHLCVLVSSLCVFSSCSEAPEYFPTIEEAAYSGDIEIPGLFPRTKVLLQSIPSREEAMLVIFDKDKRVAKLNVKTPSSSNSEQKNYLALAPILPCNATGTLKKDYLNLKILCSKRKAIESKLYKTDFSLFSFPPSNPESSNEFIQTLSQSELVSQKLNVYSEDLHKKNKELATLKNLMRDPETTVQAISRVGSNFREQVESTNVENKGKELQRRHDTLLRVSGYGVAVSLARRVNDTEWSYILHKDSPTKKRKKKKRFKTRKIDSPPPAQAPAATNTNNKPQVENTPEVPSEETQGESSGENWWQKL